MTKKWVFLLLALVIAAIFVGLKGSKYNAVIGGEWLVSFCTVGRQK